MKKLFFLGALLFSLSAMANAELEVSLSQVDNLLSKRSFSELTANCKHKVRYSRQSVETRESSEYEARYKKCSATSLTMKIKRKSGNLGPKKQEFTYTADNFAKYNGNALRELLAKVAEGNVSGNKIPYEKMSVYKIEEQDFTLLTKDGYKEFKAVYVWVDLEDEFGNVEQMHITLGNDSRLPYHGQILELFYKTTYLLQIYELK